MHRGCEPRPKQLGELVVVDDPAFSPAETSRWNFEEDEGRVES